MSTEVYPGAITAVAERITAVETQLRELVEQLAPVLAREAPPTAPAQVPLALEQRADGRVSNDELRMPVEGDDRWLGLAVDAWVFAAADVGGIEYGQIVAVDAKTVTVKTRRHGTVLVPNVPSRVWPAPQGFGAEPGGRTP